LYVTANQHIGDAAPTIRVGSETAGSLTGPADGGFEVRLTPEGAAALRDRLDAVFGRLGLSA
jgi:hypothetical protein